MRLRPHARTQSIGEGVAGPSKVDVEDDVDGPIERLEGQTEVMWEVGSVSDGSVTEDQDRRGVGGGQNSKGERRGLLVDEEEEGEEGYRETKSKRPVTSGTEENPFADEDEGFGEYEGVGTEDLPPPDPDDKK